MRVSKIGCCSHPIPTPPNPHHLCVEAGRPPIVVTHMEGRPTPCSRHGSHLRIAPDRSATHRTYLPPILATLKGGIRNSCNLSKVSNLFSPKNWWVRCVSHRYPLFQLALLRILCAILPFLRPAILCTTHPIKKGSAIAALPFVCDGSEGHPFIYALAPPAPSAIASPRPQARTTGQKRTRVGRSRGQWRWDPPPPTLREP